MNIAKAVDFSKTKDGAMRGVLLKFLVRREAASLRTIERWFSATPSEFVRSEIDHAIEDGVIAIRRNGLSRRAGYAYVINSESRD
jgi:hypothetical protein